MNKLLALADRVEKLTGPDREVDVRISLALSGVSYSDTDVADLLTVRDEPTGYGRYRPADEYVPAYTASVDAALKLVPKDHMWSVESTGFYARVECYPGAGESAALALTCAALRARAHGGGE